LISIFTKENLDAEKGILEKLGLGTELRFKIDPRKPYTPQSIWAMRIVLWIDCEKARATSIYQKVVPGLGDFATANATAWDKAIKFHLDYFQSPGELRWKKWVSESHLEDNDEPDEGDGLAADERYRQGQTAYLIRNSGPVGDITELSDFTKLLGGYKKGKPKSKAQQYATLKDKITGAAHDLMR
jgi:hypothetical protein